MYICSGGEAESHVAALEPRTGDVYHERLACAWRMNRAVVRSVRMHVYMYVCVYVCL